MITSDDIKILESKIGNSFELPIPYDEDRIIKEIESILEESSNLNEHIQYNRYKSHYYGRIRCKAIYDMTKEEIFGTDYNKSRLEATKDLQNMFYAFGGVIM